MLLIGTCFEMTLDSHFSNCHLAIPSICRNEEIDFILQGKFDKKVFINNNFEFQFHNEVAKVMMSRLLYQIYLK